MSSFQSRGSALLLCTPLPASARRLAAPVDETFVELAAAVRSAGWNVQVVRKATVDRVHACVGALNRAPCDVRMLIVAGAIRMDDEPILVANPDDSSTDIIPLARFRPGVGDVPTVVVICAWEDGERSDSAACLRVLRSTSREDLVAVATSTHALPCLEWLRLGLAGAALDATANAVTPLSLGRFLQKHVAGIEMQPPTGQRSTLLAPSWAMRLTTVATRELDATDEPSELVGTVLPGQFRVDEVLGTGGFGTVYRARQLAIERDVAIKVLHGSIDLRSSDGQLFVSEIQAVGRIDHRNVVRILHADLTAGGRLFYAMELLPGVDLERLAAESLTTARAINLISQVLAGLSAAHEAGLVHADLKPANIVVVPGRGDERAALVDFGLARLRELSSHVHSVGGTPAYMAPEQLAAGKVDVRSDVFSAGLVLFRLVTGWRRRKADDIVPPLDLITDEQLRRVLHSALARDPEERYPSAAAFADALAGLGTDAKRTRRRAAVGVAVALLGASTYAAVATLSSGENERRSGAGTIGGRVVDDKIIVGGSGTVMWGFIAPLNAFLEGEAGAEIPVSSKYDAGSGGAVRGLLDGVIDVAGLSARYENAVPNEATLLEVAIGFDETSFFVVPPNPIHKIDVDVIRTRLCCEPGAAAGSSTWREFGVIEPALAAKPVTWVMFGRRTPTTTASTSSTLRLADEWLCAPKQLCPSPLIEGIQADEVIGSMKDETALALSSRSFATTRVAPVAVVDKQRGLRLDSRKTLWLYILVRREKPIGSRMCRFLSGVLHAAVSDRLAASGKAIGLPDPLRRRAREVLGLDDGRCNSTSVDELARQAHLEISNGIVRSPIANDVEIKTRWIPISDHDASPDR